MGPSDSRHAFGPSFGLPCFRPPALNRACGSLRFLGHPLRTCREHRPRFVPCPHVPSREGLAAVFRLPNTLDTPNLSFSRLTSHGPCVRAPSHRRARCRPLLPSPLHARRQASLPTCMAALVGRVSHPLDDASVFLLGIRTSIPTDQPCLIAPGTGRGGPLDTGAPGGSGTRAHRWRHTWASGATPPTRGNHLPFPAPRTRRRGSGSNRDSRRWPHCADSVSPQEEVAVEPAREPNRGTRVQLR